MQSHHSESAWQSMEELHPASVTFTPAKIYCIIKLQTTKTITFIFMIVSLCQVKKKKGHFKAWEWRGAFHRLLCCKKKDHYQRHRNCSKGWNHSWHIKRGSQHCQHYLGWGDRQAGSAAAAWPGDDAPHHLQGFQGTSCSLPFIWARQITAEPHRCQRPWTSVQAALQKCTGEECLPLWRL